MKKIASIVLMGMILGLGVESVSASQVRTTVGNELNSKAARDQIQG